MSATRGNVAPPYKSMLVGFLAFKVFQVCLVAIVFGIGLNLLGAVRGQPSLRRAAVVLITTVVSLEPTPSTRTRRDGPSRLRKKASQGIDLADPAYYDLRHAW